MAVVFPPVFVHIPGSLVVLAHNDAKIRGTLQVLLTATSRVTLRPPSKKDLAAWMRSVRAALR